MIPKVIHYCWFGGKEKPDLVKKCIKSWEEFLPDYKIVEWNEDSFDVNVIQYTAEAYKENKYAFVSDYVRLYVLYLYGGLYFDTDVELLRSLPNDFLDYSFLACEKQGGNIYIAPGLAMGFYPLDNFIKELLDSYDNQSFYSQDGTLNTYTINCRVSSNMKSLGWVPNNKLQDINGIRVYPSDYFCPFDNLTQKMHKTKNTYTIHWYAGSWTNQSVLKKIKRLVKKYILPEKLFVLISKSK